MVEQFSQNYLCWAILLLAMICYYQLWMEYLKLNAAVTNNTEIQQADIELKKELSTVLISILPLMGLLGTIVGLLDCFVGIANQGASSNLVSSGIADALLTTQLGLVCAVPGWLLQAYIRALYTRKKINVCASEAPF